MTTNRDEDIDIHRRAVGSIFGLLGGAVGLSALASCAEAGATERVGATRQALSGGSFLWVDSIAGGAGTSPNLRSVTGSDSDGSSQPVAVVGGFAAPGDGGGGTFYWSALPQTDDGGTFIVPGGAPGSVGPGWQRLFSGAYNVKWFGAKGDGMTADDVAIQATIKAATGYDNAVSGSAATRPGSVYLPLGNYILTQTLVLVAGALQCAIRGEVGGGFGTNGSFSYSGTVLSWGSSVASAPSPSYDGSGSPTSGVMLELRSFDRGLVENLDFDGCLRAGICVWYHSNQGNKGTGSDASVFRRCSFLNVAGGSSNSVLVLVGDYPVEWQTDNTVWEECAFFAAQASSTITAGACWRAANGGNTKNFAFYNCAFSGALYGIDWPIGSGTLLVDNGGFGPIGRPSWAGTSNAACIRLGPGCTATVRDLEVESFPELWGSAGGVRFVDSASGGTSFTASSLTIEACTVYLTMPSDNIIVAHPGKLTLIGNDFFAGYGGLPSGNLNPPQIATGPVTASQANTAPVTVFSMNNFYPFLPFGSYAPLVQASGGVPLPLTGPGSLGGLNKSSVWSIGDTSSDSSGTGIVLRPWIGLLPEIGPSLKTATNWAPNPVASGGASMTQIINWAGATGGSVAVGDVLFVSSDQALPGGAVLSATCTAPNQITITCLNFSGSELTLGGNLTVSVWPRT